MNKLTHIPKDAEPWEINLIDLKNRVGKSVKQIAEEGNLSEKSVANVFGCKAKNPGVDLIRRIIHVLGGSWREIFGESDAVIGNQDLVALQAKVDELTKENDILKSSLDFANLEISSQKEKISALETETKILSLKLEYEEKIHTVHDFYNKLLARE